MNEQLLLTIEFCQSLKNLYQKDYYTLLEALNRRCSKKRCFNTGVFL